MVHGINVYSYFAKEYLIILESSQRTQTAKAEEISASGVRLIYLHS